MKILTILGTRPEIIRLSRIIPLLDDLVDHKLVFTGQNYTKNLKDVFFDQLEVRKPDYDLDCRGESSFEQIASILVEAERILKKEKPDRMLILGDTNSALSSIVSKRMGIPVYHMEAGNRCFDDRVPEEVNRRLIDHSSDILMPYTERSRANLLREGIEGHRIFVTGNPIFEVLSFYESKIDSSGALGTYKVKKGEYFLVSLHRAENVDDKDRLKNFLAGLAGIYQDHQYPVIISVHPRTRKRLDVLGGDGEKEGLTFIEAPGFFEFVNLEKNAACVLSDSGTVQEENAIFKVPNVTLRDVTERPETIESGSNILSGAAPVDIRRAVKTALQSGGRFDPPDGYLKSSVSRTVTRILIGYNHNISSRELPL